MPPEHAATGPTPADAPAARLPESRILESLAGLDLTSADGRAGIATLLSEIERACPGAILQQAAGIELGRLGWSRSSSEAPRAGWSHPPRSSSEAPRAER
jgi:hypothetical protein